MTEYPRLDMKKVPNISRLCKKNRDIDLRNLMEAIKNKIKSVGEKRVVMKQPHLVKYMAIRMLLNYEIDTKHEHDVKLFPEDLIVRATESLELTAAQKVMLPWVRWYIMSHKGEYDIKRTRLTTAQFSDTDRYSFMFPRVLICRYLGPDFEPIQLDKITPMLEYYEGKPRSNYTLKFGGMFKSNVAPFQMKMITAETADKFVKDHPHTIISNEFICDMSNLV